MDIVKKYAQYEGGYTKDSQISLWLFEILSEYDNVMIAKFLFFLTGSFKIPIDEFKEKVIKINKTYEDDN